MTDLTDPYDVLASIPKEMEYLYAQASQKVTAAKIEMETLLHAKLTVEELTDGAKEWRAKTPKPAPLVLDDAARERAYAVAISRTNLVGNWDREEDIRQLVDEIFDAAAGTREAG